MSSPYQNTILPTGFFAAAPPPPPPPSSGRGEMAAIHYDYSNTRHAKPPASSDPTNLASSETHEQPHSFPDTLELSKKRPREDEHPSLFHCDACDLSLDTKAALQAHLDSHTKCSQCDFTAAPKVVKAHYESAHGKFAGSGFKTVTVAVPGCAVQRFRICVGNNPQDIQKWKNDRKRRFPRQNQVEATVSEPIPKDEPQGVASLLAGYSSSEDEVEETKPQPSLSKAEFMKASAPTANVTNDKLSKRGVCRFFARQGTCRNGDNCLYSHDAEVANQQSRPPLVLPRDRSKDTLLGKLLSNDVKRERCLTIQLLEYMVRSDFLTKEP